MRSKPRNPQARITELEAEVKKGHANEELQAHEIERLETRVNKLEKIKDWLRRRARIAGMYISRPHRTWGISANAMVEYALGGEFPNKDIYPLDKFDMEACKLCRDSCPFELGDKMDEVLKIYQERFDKAQNPVAGEPPVGGPEKET